ncbi:hypothetical protein [Rhodocaloribacter sp.]
MDPILQLVIAQIPLLALMAVYFYVTRERPSVLSALQRSKKSTREKPDASFQEFSAQVETSLGVMRTEIKGQKKEIKALLGEIEALRETVEAQRQEVETLRAERAEMLDALEGAVQTARQSATTAQRIEEMTRQFMKQRAAAKEIENVLSPRNKRTADAPETADGFAPEEPPPSPEPQPEERPRPAPVVNIKQRAHGLFGTSAERGGFGSRASSP